MAGLEGLAQRLEESAKSSGLYYPDGFLRGLEIALRVPYRFTVFYGPPGVGKTRLVQLVAEALEAELHLVPVQANWRDSSALVGTFDFARGRFLPGILTALALRAAAAPERCHLLCLEEISLGEPEAFLTTLLVGCDSNPPRLLLDLPSNEVPCGEGIIKREVPLPKNLLFFGTLCVQRNRAVDLPNRLLDHAILFELDFAHLRRFLSECGGSFSGKGPLLAVCELLQGHGIKIGYRAFREIGLALSGIADSGPEADQLLDQQIKGRILTSIHGDRAAVEDCLRDLIKLLSEREMRFPETLDKALRMLEELELHGYTAAYLS